MGYTPITLTEEDIIHHLPETIGQVSLNYDFYPGEDKYSDGAIEDELLEIASSCSRMEYPQIIEEKKKWPILYHLSPVRGNIVDFLPITSKDKVLEIGSGCGAITDTLSKKAHSVTCVDLSKKRSFVNANRNHDRNNITIHVGNFNDIEPTLDTDFDYVCLIGVFEYGASYIPTETPYEDFLNIILKHVKKNGRVIIAIENKFGLKYWAGCAEDHNGEYYSSIEGYPNGGSARTFTRQGLEKIFKKCGVDEYSFYYPYPDYKLMHTLYSDKRLPQKGELTDNTCNYDRNRLKTFNESFAFDSIIEDDEFPMFSNSYLAIIGPDIDTKYVKFSNDRKEEYAIRTEITVDEVIKVPMDMKARNHLKRMAEAYTKLKARYEGSGLKINKCVFDDDTGIAHFEFEKGISLEVLMDEALFNKDFKKFEELFDKYYEYVSYNTAAGITNYDMIFANILVSDECWTVIDYEWTFDANKTSEEVAYRALYCYLLENQRRNCFDFSKLTGKIGITEEMAELFREREKTFQKSVTGNRESLGEIRATIGTYVIDTVELAEKELKRIVNERIQVYFDNGEGYSEQNSKYIPDVYKDKNHIEADIEFDGNVKMLRIDPADFRAVVKINELVINGINVLDNKKFIQTNGKTIKYGTYVFNTEDPNINLRLNEVLIKGENVLHIDMEVIPVSAEIALDISNSIKKLF